MSRRVIANDGGNLELLLDTMCNAFGGVMFIALLLAVLSQFAEVAAPNGDDSPAVKVKVLNYESLQQDVKTLRNKLAQQERVLDRMAGVTPRVKEFGDLMRGNTALEGERDRWRAEAGKATGRIDKLTGDKSDIERDITDIDRRITFTGEQIEAAEGEEEIRVVFGGVLDPPERKRTTLWFLVKWNRLYFTRLPTPRSAHGPVNTSAVKYTGDDLQGRGTRNTQTFEARSDRGIPLNGPGWKDSENVTDLLRYAPTGDYSLRFAVYPDSYATFLPVLDYFRIEKRYRYNWHIMPNADSKLLLSSGIAPDPEYGAGR